MSRTRSILDRHDLNLTLNYPRYPVAMAAGSGVWLTDAEGKKYLDLFSGFGAGILGHCHPDLVQAVADQAQRLWHVGNLLHTEPQTQLAQAISSLGFGGRSYFCHSGSDANESAFKLARLYGKGKRHKVISTTGSFHGRGFAAMMATGQEKVRQGYEPHLAGFLQVAYDDPVALESAVDDQTVAVIVEPIQGESGVRVPGDEYLPALRRICDAHDLLLILDEVWTGCGRTGKFFGHQHTSIQPDLMTLGKGVGGGLPLGVMCASTRAAECFQTQSYGGVPHATTLGGNCLTMAVGARLMEVLQRDNLVQRAADLGRKALARLQAFAQSRNWIRQVRGRGLFIGIELDPAAPCGAPSDLVGRGLEMGLLINASGPAVLRLAPALVISDEELSQGLGMLEDLLEGSP